MIVHRTLLRLLPALVAALLFAALPAAAEPQTQPDAAVAVHDGAAQTSAPAPKQADHTSRRPHRNADLEEFIAVDDDPEQNSKLLTFAAVETAGVALAIPVLDRMPNGAPPVRRLGTPFPTGPPHA